MKAGDVETVGRVFREDGIGLLLGSWNAIVLALFYHAYIWVHMYCTEDPDMRILYK